LDNSLAAGRSWNNSPRPTPPGETISGTPFFSQGVGTLHIKPSTKVCSVNDGCHKPCNAHAHSMVLYDGFLCKEGGFLCWVKLYMRQGTQDRALPKFRPRHS
jgi:hypothetical protein